MAVPKTHIDEPNDHTATVIRFIIRWRMARFGGRMRFPITRWLMCLASLSPMIGE